MKTLNTFITIGNLCILSAAGAAQAGLVGANPMGLPQVSTTVQPLGAVTPIAKSVTNPKGDPQKTAPKLCISPGTLDLDGVCRCYIPGAWRYVYDNVTNTCVQDTSGDNNLLLQNQQVNNVLHNQLLNKSTSCSIEKGLVPCGGDKTGTQTQIISVVGNGCNGAKVGDALSACKCSDGRDFPASGSCIVKVVERRTVKTVCLESTTITINSAYGYKTPYYFLIDHPRDAKDYPYCAGDWFVTMKSAIKTTYSDKSNSTAYDDKAGFGAVCPGVKGGGFGNDIPWDTNKLDSDWKALTTPTRAYPECENYTVNVIYN